MRNPFRWSYGIWFMCTIQVLKLIEQMPKFLIFIIERHASLGAIFANALLLLKRQPITLLCASFQTTLRPYGTYCTTAVVFVQLPFSKAADSPMLADIGRETVWKPFVAWYGSGDRARWEFCDFQLEFLTIDWKHFREICCFCSLSNT